MNAFTITELQAFARSQTSSRLPAPTPSTRCTMIEQHAITNSTRKFVTSVRALRRLWQLVVDDRHSASMDAAAASTSPRERVLDELRDRDSKCTRESVKKNRT